MPFLICINSIDTVADKLLPQPYQAISIHIEKFRSAAMDDIYRHIPAILIKALCLSVTFRFFF